MPATARLDYGLRALVALANADRPLTGRDIAERDDLPAKFLFEILSVLRRGGLIHSRRGPHGGYWLARPPEEISVADVMHVLDGDPDTASSATPLAAIWARLDDVALRTAADISLADLQRQSVRRCRDEDASHGPAGRT